MSLVSLTLALPHQFIIIINTLSRNIWYGPNLPKDHTLKQTAKEDCLDSDMLRSRVGLIILFCQRFPWFQKFFILLSTKQIDTKVQINFKVFILYNSFYLAFLKPIRIMQSKKQLKIVVQGVKIPISKQMYRAMKYFEQWQVLSSPQEDTFQLADKSIVSLVQWEMIIQILQHYKYELPSLPKVRTNDPYSIIGPFLTDKFKTMSRTQLSRLYVAAHYLKVKNLRAAIAAYYATKVFFQGEKDYEQRLKENKVKNPLQNQLYQTYRENYPFLNHY